jgi:hypothetical protein
MFAFIIDYRRHLCPFGNIFSEIKFFYTIQHIGSANVLMLYADYDHRSCILSGFGRVRNESVFLRKGCGSVCCFYSVFSEEVGRKCIVYLPLRSTLF